MTIHQTPALQLPPQALPVHRTRVAATAALGTAAGVEADGILEWLGKQADKILPIPDIDPGGIVDWIGGLF
ncbi:hypothetical protein OHV05_06400 [Kitasatospora sp. NBC_00070]|uniref:hypothetical protein n=1 Tax=Kitasatospora sp. NBC_00070 TaxID=2975962 RepID=UPI00324CAB45